MQSFRNIRYGRAERFGAAEVVAFDGNARQDGPRGPISPQSPSRLEFAMGPPPEMVQDEHCQILSIFTPTRDGKRPVMVWFHGGAFVSGGGEMPWYDGHRIAEEQDVVVVSVTYRLGALGFLHLPGGVGPSPGTTDQIAALRWVRAHIADFGGDPTNVTAFGQSAGAWSIRTLMAWGHGGDLFDRAILQSGAMPGERTREEVAAEGSIEQFLGLLGTDPMKATPEELLAAQATAAMQGGLKSNAIVNFSDWLPVTPEDPSWAYVDSLVGWTANDLMLFAYLMSGQTPSPDANRRLLRSMSAAMDRMLIDGSNELAQAVVAAGKRAWLYRLDWLAPRSGLWAAHCIDLPLLLGNEEAWRSAPMIEGLPWPSVEAMGKSVRARWGRFARGEAPDADWRETNQRCLCVNIMSEATVPSIP